jgi:hypothetical protein
MSFYKDYYEQHHKARKPRIKYKSFLVRDSGNYQEVLFIVKLEDEKYWGEAKKYLWEKRQDDVTYSYKSDREIMEEYWQKNNINYVIVKLPDDELYL